MKVVPTHSACPKPNGSALSSHPESCQRRTWIDAAADLLLRVMPDLPVLGAAMLLLVAILAATGSNFGVDAATQAAIQQAQEAAATEVPVYRPF